MTELDLCVRLAAAAALGGVIGLEREMANRPAGLRTHLVVCVAAALLTTSSVLFGEHLNVPGEALRVAAGVVTGIGFIGAGTILQTKHRVHGLTTAATVFMAAALGIAVGGGYYYLALTAAGITVLSTWGLRYFEPSESNAVDTEDDDEPRRVEVDKPRTKRNSAHR
jgi:putative Mg2+ transporter-C (MgtC) family protein